MATTDLGEENRRALARRGVARLDGSYPIADLEDLENAIRDYNRTDQPATVKQWIIRRARALDLVSHLPEEWHVPQ